MNYNNTPPIPSTQGMTLDAETNRQLAALFQRLANMSRTHPQSENPATAQNVTTAEKPLTDVAFAKAR